MNLEKVFLQAMIDLGLELKIFRFNANGIHYKL